MFFSGRKKELGGRAVLAAAIALVLALGAAVEAQSSRRSKSSSSNQGGSQSSRQTTRSAPTPSRQATRTMPQRSMPSISNRSAISTRSNVTRRQVNPRINSSVPSRVQTNRSTSMPTRSMPTRSAAPTRIVPQQRTPVSTPSNSITSRSITQRRVTTPNQSTLPTRTPTQSRVPTVYSRSSTPESTPNTATPPSTSRSVTSPSRQSRLDLSQRTRSRILTPSTPSTTRSTVQSDSRLDQLRTRRQTPTTRTPSVTPSDPSTSIQSRIQRDSRFDQLRSRRENPTTAKTPSVEVVRPQGTRDDAVRQRESVVRRLVEKQGSVQAETRAPRSGIDRIRAQTRDRIDARRTESVVRTTDSKLDRTERVRVAGRELRDRTKLAPRLDAYSRRHGTRADIRRLDRSPRDLSRRPRVVYHDRPDLVRHRPNNIYVYRDRYDRLCHRIIWPRYHYPIYYSWGPHVRYRWVYPYYHRKYVFVSLGGWWPWDYTYTRYYWYGWHPYTWYGYYPVPREVDTGTTNYYTYNYYTADEGATASADVLPYGIDAETLGKVQQRVAAQNAAEPAPQTQADVYFENGVTQFEAGQYAAAAQAFAAAMELSPDDRILPFAYAQALFADKQYSDAANVLRMALQHVAPEEQGVFYPRGLYADDDVLFTQIENLLDKTEDYASDGNLQLLLGYHLLGVGETEYARPPLEQARQDMQNARAAQTLLDLLAKMETVETDGADQSASTATPDAGATTSGAARTNVLKRIDAGATANTQVQTPAPSVNLGPARKEDDEK